VYPKSFVSVTDEESGWSYRVVKPKLRVAI